MRLIRSIDDDGLQIARSDVENGTPDDLVARAEMYLELLDEHLDGLRSLKNIPRSSLTTQSGLVGMLIEQIRGSIRTDIEDSTSEKNRITSLLESLTMVTGWASIETLNQNNFHNASDWELIGTSVRSAAAGASMTIPEAVTEASRLRREAFFVVRSAA